MPPTLARLIVIVVLAVLGGAGVYLLLPRPRRHNVLIGGVVAFLALLMLGVVLGPVAPSPESFLFYVFSGVAVISGCLLITQRNPARAALSFALVVVSTCGLFLLQAAPFLMAATVIIYAGAIIVTFLFVLMLAQQEGPSDADARSREPLSSVLAGAVLLGILLYVLSETYLPPGLDELDRRLAQVGRLAEDAQAAPSEDLLGQAAEALAGLQQWVNERRPEAEDRPDARPSPLPDGGEALSLSLTNAREQVAAQRHNAGEGKPVEWDKVRQALLSVQAAGQQAHAQVGSLPVPAKISVHGGRDPLPVSAYSGPAVNVAPGELRRDASGQAQLPAENVGYLGRSLFTDYLLPVELGGTLLLAATIGAIAIATRRAERLP
jgi:NADH:ubiquinone oxidoreductase subunit 6 (subunit J)